MDLNFDKIGGLLPAIVQESGTGKVLMLGFMNQEALDQTIQSGYVTFFSRSRNQLWVKGESSGHKLRVHDVLVDCDLDTLLVIAEQYGPGTCHEGYHSCFYRRIQGEHLIEAEPRTYDPAAVYVSNVAGPAGAARKE
jgi:phosphoribosyl-AMP cyclohydrolase